MKYEIGKQTFIMQNTLIYLKIPKEKFEYLIVSYEAYFYLTNRIWDRTTYGWNWEAFVFFETFSFLRNFRH